jgi:hypothetical protein
MFGWFRKKEKQVPAEKLVAAHELGRRAAASANADIEAYMRSRFYPAVPSLVDSVFGDFNTPDVPPLVAARVDLKNFLDRIDGDLRPTLLIDLRNAMAGWLGAFNQAGMGSEFELLIEHHYESFKSSAVLAAFQKLLDLTDTLKVADDEWRAAYPKKADEIPFDTFGPELGDALAPYVKGSGVERRS